MRFTRFVTLAVSLVMAVAGPIPETHVVHERRGIHSLSHAASEWVKIRRLSGDTVLPVRIGLKQRNIDKGEEWLLDVSHPNSPNYGKHWTSDEVIEAFRPSRETVDAVREWLVAEGIAAPRISHSDNKGWLAFDATTAELERLIHAEYHEYEHSKGGRKEAACDQYSLPKNIQEHIDYIKPGIKGVQIQSLMSTRVPKIPPKSKPANLDMKNINDTSTCDKLITPACIRALYHIPLQDPGAQVSPNNSIGMFEEGDVYAQGDLDMFFAKYTAYIPKGTHPIQDLVDGATAPASLGDSGPESTLDFELAYPIVYPQTVTLYQVDDAVYSAGGSPAKGIFNTFFDAIDGSYCTYSAYGETGNDPVLDPTYPDPAPEGYKGQLQCGVYKPTNVISISYGLQEMDLPDYYQKRQCDEFMKLGLQGVSIFVASGDTGVGGTGGRCLGPNNTIFSPTQPNSCPWLTNVGSTFVAPGHKVSEPEVATQSFGSGGGFSNIFGIPSYQQTALTTYFAKHNPPYPYYNDGQYNSTTNGLYNRNGRGIPDVAANGDNIDIATGGVFGIGSGTSASSPIFASIINRIIEERLKIGKGPLGFINPVLYEHPEVLTDITNGNNPGCGTDGFSAVKGWDPVTGLGTPNYPKMLELFLGLP